MAWTPHTGTAIGTLLGMGLGVGATLGVQVLLAPVPGPSVEPGAPLAQTVSAATAPANPAGAPRWAQAPASQDTSHGVAAPKSTHANGQDNGGEPAVVLAAASNGFTALVPPPAPEPREVSITVSRGDTLIGLLQAAGVERQTAHEAVTALKAVFDPRRLKVGQELTLAFTPMPEAEDAQAERLDSLSLTPDVDRIAAVKWSEAGFEASETAIEMTIQRAAAAGEITSSLYLAAIEAGMPETALLEVIRIFSFAVDFQRDIQKHDAFRVLYEAEHRAEDGDFAQVGDVLMAELLLQGKPLTVYRFTDDDGFVDYYDQSGESIRQVLMRTPIDGARLTSRFGPRKHPILGYTRQHKGIDFAAPRGTPIFAAGDGFVDFVGTRGGFGKYVRLRHTAGLKTAYAHMRGYAKGITRGARVTQGQVIGYVGSTGQSTGPHLHYEVHRDGVAVNPLSVDLPSGKTLTGGELDRFKTLANRLETDFRAIHDRTVVAQAGGGR